MQEISQTCPELPSPEVPELPEYIYNTQSTSHTYIYICIRSQQLLTVFARHEQTLPWSKLRSVPGSHCSVLNLCRGRSFEEFQEASVCSCLAVAEALVAENHRLPPPQPFCSGRSLANSRKPVPVDPCRGRRKPVPAAASAFGVGEASKFFQEGPVVPHVRRSERSFLRTNLVLTK